MFGFGNKKKDDDEKDERQQQEQVSQAMRNMSDQIAAQAKEIKELEEKLAAASKEAASGDAAEKALRDAQARMRSMQAELQKAKTAAEKAAAGTAGAAAAAGSVGVTKIGPKADAPAAPLGGAAPAEAPAAAPGGLTIGHTAFVRQTGGKNLRLRNGPGLNTNAFDGLAPGTSMTLLEGPLEKDGYPWYRIRTVDGREGWVAGTELVTQPE